MIALTQGAHDARADLHHIVFALAQVFILKRIKLRNQLVDLLGQSPFCVVAFVRNQIERGLRNQLIACNHAVHREHCAHFNGRIGVQIALQLCEFVLHRLQGCGKARQLIANLLTCY